MTAMRSFFALLALVVALASAQSLETNGGFDGCATTGVANDYKNDLASAPVTAYFTFAAPPAALGTCITDFYDATTGNILTNIEQDMTGAASGVTYRITITVGSGQPGSDPIDFELYVADLPANLPVTPNAVVTVAAPPANTNPTTATLTFDYAATAATITVRIVANLGAGLSPGTPVADNLVVVDASTVGDPHFVGFQGQVFDFIGEPDTAYNLLSDFDVQFNTFLFLRRQTHHSFIPGPVMKELVCLVDGHVVYINCGGYERPEVGYVTVDGLRLVDGQKLSLGRLSVGYKTISAWSKDYGMAGKDYLVGSVNIHIDGAYAFHVVLVENGRNINNPNIWVTALPQRYLDFSSHIIDHTRQPHGVFGQTSRLEVALDQWTIEGAETDYVLKDGVFGSDFTFNKFQQ